MQQAVFNIRKYKVNCITLDRLNLHSEECRITDNIFHMWGSVLFVAYACNRLVIPIVMQWHSQYGVNGARAPPETPKVTCEIRPDPMGFLRGGVGNWMDVQNTSPSACTIYFFIFIIFCLLSIVTSQLLWRVTTLMFTVTHYPELAAYKFIVRRAICKHGN
jgi:hypothetical protein